MDSGTLAPMASNRPRVLIVGDRRRKGVAEGVADHRDFLAQHLEIVAVDLDEDIDLANVDADFILVFGGDGSILHVARRLNDNPIPILGVNYGRFGFLADVSPEDLQDGIRNYLAGDFVTSERARLRVRFLKDGEIEHETLAFNDVVLGRDNIGRMVDVDVHIDGREAIRYSGDGLILATATGSTAHAMAAGGPLLDPTVNAIVMVPIAPHSLATRPVVLAGDHKIELRCGQSRAPVSATVDGAEPIPLTPNHSVEVFDAHVPVRLLRVSGRPFYDALRSKLGWRGRPVYREEDPVEQAD